MGQEALPLHVEPVPGVSTSAWTGKYKGSLIFCYQNYDFLHRLLETLLLI